MATDLKDLVVVRKKQIDSLLELQKNFPSGNKFYNHILSSLMNEDKLISDYRYEKSFYQFIEVPFTFKGVTVHISINVDHALKLIDDTGLSITNIPKRLFYTKDSDRYQIEFTESQFISLKPSQKPVAPVVILQTNSKNDYFVIDGSHRLTFRAYPFYKRYIPTFEISFNMLKNNLDYLLMYPIDLELFKMITWLSEQNEMA